MKLCIGAPSVRCCSEFDTDGAVLTFWSFDIAPTVIGAVSDMATPHRTAGQPNLFIYSMHRCDTDGEIGSCERLLGWPGGAVSSSMLTLGGLHRTNCAVRCLFF